MVRHLASLLLCYATAISYAELSKLYPGAGSSYFYAEQAFLAKSKAFKFARVAKFFTGWASHLYYWVYPGLMVGVTAMLIGYLAPFFFPNTFSATYNSPLLMYLFCIVFAVGVSYIAYRGVNGSTAVNIAINIIQITALWSSPSSRSPTGCTTRRATSPITFRTASRSTTRWPRRRQTDDKGNPLPVLDANDKPTKNADGTPAYVMQDAQDADGNPTPGDANGKAVALDKAAPFTIDYSTRAWSVGFQQQRAVQLSPDCQVGHRAAQLQLRLHPGLHRHPVPRRL